MSYCEFQNLIEIRCESFSGFGVFVQAGMENDSQIDGVAGQSGDLTFTFCPFVRHSCEHWQSIRRIVHRGGDYRSSAVSKALLTTTST